MIRHLIISVFCALCAVAMTAQDKPTPQMVAKAKAGDFDTAWQLAEMYRDGIGTRMDLQKAMDFFAIAADPNNWDAQENAKDCYIQLLEKRGESFGWDDEAWMKFDKIYADKGYGWALHNLGVYYEYSDKGKNLTRALDYYTRAAKKKDIIAAYRLGEAYFQGLPLSGGVKDMKKAAAYYQQVIDTKLAPEVERKDLKSVACQRLSGLYRFGRGVPESVNKANSLLKQAEALGNVDAAELNRKLAGR